MLVGAKIQARTQRQSEVGAVGGNAETGKHFADGDRAEVGEQVDQEIAIHLPSSRPSAQLRTGAGTHTPRLLVEAVWSTISATINSGGYGSWLLMRNCASGPGRQYQSTFAAVSCTDSPQPQALTWLGLLKMNWACILSAL